MAGITRVAYALARAATCIVACNGCRSSRLHELPTFETNDISQCRYLIHASEATLRRPDEMSRALWPALQRVH